MKILHYFDKPAAQDLTSDSISQLVSAEGKTENVRTVSGSDNFLHTLDEYKPDIIHFHACWQKRAFKLCKAAITKEYPIVLSTHWGLNSHARYTEQHIEKLLKAICYQYKFVKSVDALILDDAKEREAILKLEWKTRIDVIPSSLLDSSISADVEAEQMIAFYRKVLATRYQYGMSPFERELIPSIMHVGLSQTDTRNLLPSNQLIALREVNPEQWKRLFLYAEDEGIRDIFNHCIQQLQLNAPLIDTALIDRYPLLKAKNIQDLLLDDKAKKIKKEKLSDKADNLSAVMQDIIASIYMAKLYFRKGTLSMHHIGELYQIIKYNDYDEEKLKQILKHLKLHRFARRLIQILKEYVQLEEGFIPILPLDDKGTQRIRKMFDKRK